MRLGYELTIEQKQQLSMTPELIQAIKILQLNNMDLFDYVQSELTENPILEEAPSSAEEGPQEQKMEEVRDHLAEDEYDDRADRQWESRPDKEKPTFEDFATEVQTLQDFLLEQMQLSDLSSSQRRICRFLIEAIDENGYLTMTCQEVAETLSVTIDEVESVLLVVQQMDPLGVGARSLAECLKIQLRERNLLTEEMEYVIDNMLGEVADNKVSQISKKIGLKPKEVQTIIDYIRSLEPKPGRQFSSGDSTRYIVPDILVEKVDGEYVVQSNDASIPKLMVSSYYKKLSQRAKEDEELDKYLSGRFNAATWLIRSIEQRKQTIFNVAAAIVHYQREFFERGDRYIKTLTLKQIAEELAIHESTVSRAINGKYLQSPRGIYELRYFFSSGVALNGEERGISSNSVKSMIRKIIEGENPKKPYSDQDMVAMLEKEGIDISRRTVAKYREGMGILSSSKRRRY